MSKTDCACKPGSPCRKCAIDELSELETRFAGPGPGALNFTPAGRAALQPRIDELRELLGQHFWQRTQAAVASVLRMPAGKHEEHVRAALRAGKNVPAEVLKDYPNI